MVAPPSPDATFSSSIRVYPLLLFMLLLTQHSRENIVNYNRARLSIRYDDRAALSTLICTQRTFSLYLRRENNYAQTCVIFRLAFEIYALFADGINLLLIYIRLILEQFYDFLL